MISQDWMHLYKITLWFYQTISNHCTHPDTHMDNRYVRRIQSHLLARISGRHYSLPEKLYVIVCLWFVSVTVYGIISSVVPKLHRWSTNAQLWDIKPLLCASLGTLWCLNWIGSIFVLLMLVYSVLKYRNLYVQLILLFFNWSALYWTSEMKNDPLQFLSES